MAVRRGWRGLIAPLLMVVLGLGRAKAEAAGPCPIRPAGEPLALSPLLRPAEPSPPDSAEDYRHRLQTTPLGWPLQATWCVWVEPPEPAPWPSAQSQTWALAVNRALQEWQQVLPIVLVAEPLRAQVIVWRRRPPLKPDGRGKMRASHGRAILSLHRLPTGAGSAVQPRVEVLISPGQRLEAQQATALHELGHAFGLWGHSDEPGDAMALTPGPQPILRLSPRDRATLQWLYRQATPLRPDASPGRSDL